MSTRPIYQQATATSDASGTVLIQLPNVPAAQVWTGAVSVQNSGASTIWTIQAGAAPWGQAIGQAFAPVQCFGSGQIRVSATGTTPGTVFTAVFVGREDNFADAPASPYPVATQVSGTVQIAGTTSIAGTVSITGTVSTTGNVTVVQQQRLLGSFALAGGSGNFTITGIQSQDNFLIFSAQVASGTLNPVQISVTDPANTNVVYGIIYVSEHSWDYVSILPLQSTSLVCTWVSLIGTNPSTPINVYATQVQPSQQKKLRRAVGFQGAMTAGTKQVLLGVNSVARLISAHLSMSETAGAGATQTHLNGRIAAPAADTALGYLDAAAAAAGTGSALTSDVALNNIVVAGDGSTVNAAYYVADNTITLGACTLIYEDIALG